jgi:hypothetical protein
MLRIGPDRRYGRLPRGEIQVGHLSPDYTPIDACPIFRVACMLLTTA